MRWAAVLGEGWAGLRRLAVGPKSLERLLLLTLGGTSLAAIAIVASIGVGLLREQAAEQALSQVREAGLAARDEVRRSGEDALTTARLLASRPTLLRLVRTGSLGQLELFLRRYCDTAGLDGCAVFAADDVLAAWGEPVDWQRGLETSLEQGERFMVPPVESAGAWFGAVVEVVELPGIRVAVARTCGARLADRLGESSGHELRIEPISDWMDAAGIDFRDLHSAAVAGGQTVAVLDEEKSLYVSSTPVTAVTGEGVVLLEVRLPSAAVRGTVDRFVRRLGWTVAVVVLLALATALLLARRVGQPLRDLAESAGRLGRGDFSASIPAAGTLEVAALAATMEDMRRNLLETTAELRRSEAEAQAVLQGIVEGVFAVDEARVVRYLNPQAAALLGVAPAEAVGRFCGDLLRPCGNEGGRPCESACPILEARTAGKAQAAEQLQLGAGRRSVVVTSAAPVEGLQVQVMRDETELEAVRRARDSVLANISHEFRTPLAAQLASIELMLDGWEQLPRERLAELLRALQRGTQRLTQLIDNLLESVRIESGQLGIRRQPVDLHGVVADAQALIEGLLTQRGQSLELRLPDGLPDVDGDPQRLTQVLTNLLANASKFGPEGRAIRVGAEAAGGEVSLWVEDEGPGVPDPDRGSIFDRFYRSADAEPEPKGLGLGLWIVKSIVERHGGRVAVSRGADARTRFTVTLPASPVELP